MFNLNGMAYRCSTLYGVTKGCNQGNLYAIKGICMYSNGCKNAKKLVHRTGVKMPPKAEGQLHANLKKESISIRGPSIA